jgi:HD-like signal output (HDOD) protein/nitrogen-specific signal transduction histidine kinase
MLDLVSSVKLNIESMELVRLPSPPHILSKLLDVCHDPDSSISDLSDIISTDATLTSKIITAVNSAAFAIDQPVNDLEHTVTLLGHDLVKNMVIASSIQQIFAGLIRSQKESVSNAWLSSLYCAVFAQDIARIINYHPRHDAYLAGLFHDFGQIVFDAKFHEQYIDIIGSKTEAETIQKEISKFGISHTELGARILEQWPSQSPAISDAVRFHHETEEQLKGCDILSQIVAEASQIAAHWSRLGKADVKWQSALVSAQELERIYFQVQDTVSDIASALGIPLPKSGSLTQGQLAKNVEKETLTLARKVRDASLINLFNSEEVRSTAVNSPRSLLLKVAQEMQLLFLISDVALLLPDSENTDFLTLYEINHVQPVSKFAVDNSDSRIIKSFLENRNYWIEPGNGHVEISPISDRQIIRRLNHDIALSLPIASGGRVIGIIVIGSIKTHKINLENLSKFIAGYLEGIADMWLKNTQAPEQQDFEDNMKTEQAQKDIDKLVHEISNPLSVIGNYIDIIKANSESLGTKNDKEIKILKEELQRIGNIVLNFKDTKSPESQSVFLNEELKMCIPLYVNTLSTGNKFRIKWNLDESDSEVMITRDAFRQIVLNLVKNAVEAQSVSAEIAVSSHNFVNLDGRVFAQFSIADQGKGVDAITRQQLFSPLMSRKEGVSRGLGLSVVADILHGFNGQIKYMENENGGASFEVLIPLLI